VLALHIVRLLSVCMGTLAVYLAWLVVLEVATRRPELALGAAAVQAFTPMFTFISGAVNNDSLLVMLSSLAIWMMLRLLRSGRYAAGIEAKRYIALGVVLGLAALAKSSALALVLPTALVVGIRARRAHSWKEFLIGGLSTALPMIAISGWWFVRNLVLYGDLTGLNAFIEILGKRDVPADLAQLWRERFSFAAGYWGNFGGLNVPMASWVYVVLNVFFVASVIGLAVVLYQSLTRAPERRPLELWPSVVCLLWGAAVVVPWAVWAVTTWSSQGRLIFAALPLWSMLFVLGLTGWQPARWRYWTESFLVLFLAVLTFLAPFVWIRPAYALPTSLTNREVAAIPNRVDAQFGEVARLLGYDLESGAVKPGEQLGVTLYWEAVSPTDRDNTVFVHLLGTGDLLIAQRDSLPGLGKLSSAWWTPGARWADRYVLRVPETAYAPDSAVIEVGLYDTASRVRVPVTVHGVSGADQVRFGEVEVHAVPGSFPNPVTVNFGHRIELNGYDLDRRVIRLGEQATLTSYWEALRGMDCNYTISVQFVDSEQHKVAQLDGWPQDGAAPTSTWRPRQTVEDVRVLAVAPDAVPGVYDVRLSVYTLDNAEFKHLPVIPGDGSMMADYVILTRVRVVE